MSEAAGFQEAEELLLQGEFQDCRSLWYSSNYVYLATLCADTRQFAAVYKPLRGENPLWDFPDGTLYRREVAAYRLSRLLGWEFIPPTVVRDGPQGVGAVQLFVQHDSQLHYFEQREVPELVPQLQRMAVFDYVANNADRKGGHCLLDQHGRVWGIDHGLCFHAQYKMRTVIWDWAEEAIPGEWLDDVARAAAAIEAHDPTAAAFVSLLEPGEALALVGRARQLIESGHFPTPGPHRSYPWPLV